MTVTFSFKITGPNCLPYFRLCPWHFDLCPFLPMFYISKLLTILSSVPLTFSPVSLSAHVLYIQTAHHTFVCALDILTCVPFCPCFILTILSSVPLTFWPVSLSAHVLYIHSELIIGVPNPTANCINNSVVQSENFHNR